MNRFFVPPSAIRRNQVHFSPDQARQLRTVLRLSASDEVLALDGEGRCYRVALQYLDKSTAVGRIVETMTAGAEPGGDLILCLAITRGERFEWVLQKGVELGVTHFQPMITRRTQRKTPGDAKWQRWQRIIREAAEQCERGKLPQLAAPVTFAEAVESAQGLALLPAIRVARPARAALASATWPVTLIIGPEGGFAPEEVEMAQVAGIQPVTLGPRILRTETAAIVLLTLAAAALGELDQPARVR